MARAGAGSICLLLAFMMPLLAIAASATPCQFARTCWHVHAWRLDDLSEDHGRPLASLGGRVRGQRLEATEIHVRNMDWSYLAVALDTTRPLTQASEQTVHYSHLRARASCPGTYLIQSKAARLVTMQDGLLVLCPVQVQ